MKKIILTTLILISFIRISFSQCYSSTYSNVRSGNITSNINSGIYYFDDDVYINSNIVFTDAEILVAAGKKIIISNGQLTINGCHFYGCTQMWGGIVMSDNAQLIIDKSFTKDNTLIEDAIVGVDAFVSHVGGFYNNYLSVKNTIFNRNEKGIRLTASLIERYNLVPYNMTIESSIFTCRDIPFTPLSNTWVSISTLKAKPYVPYKSAYINDNSFSPNNSNAYLKSPATANTKSKEGIFTVLGYHRKGLFMIGGANSGTETIFDNQTTGIRVEDADLRVNNCIFQNTPGANPNNETYGILADHYDESEFNLITTPLNANSRNWFYDCKYGIVSNYFVHAIIEGNTFISSKTASLNNVQEGKEAISVRTSTIGNGNPGVYNYEVKIKGNRIINTAYGITVNYDDVPWHNNPLSLPYPQNSFPNLFNTIEIYFNEMELRLDPFVTPMPNPNYFISQGITCRVNIAVGPPVPATITIPPLRLYKNNLTLVNNGILCSNWENKDIRAIENEVTLYDGNTGFNQAISQYALKFDGGVARNENLLYANNFNAFASTSNSLAKEGITLLNNNQYSIKCNTSSSLTGHYIVNGLHNPSIFELNDLNVLTFSSSLQQRGLVLTNGGRIGQQGISTRASDNIFYPYSPNGLSWLTSNNRMAFVSSSDATLSPLYLRVNNSLYDVSQSSGSNGLGSLPYQTSNGSVINATATSRTCPDEQPRQAIIPVGDEAIEITMKDYPEFDFNTEAEIMALSEEETAIKINEMVAVAQGTTQQNNLPEGDLRLYVQQFRLYSLLISPNGLKEQSGFLQEWVADKNSGSFGRIYELGQAFANRNITLVNNLLNSWVKVNRVDENYAQYFIFKLQQLQNQNINMKDLEELCNKCPLTDGNAVIAAQCLYNSINNDHKLFDNSCGIDYSEGEAQRGISNSTKIIKPNAFESSIFPNPANTYINIIAKNPKQIVISNILGKQVSVNKVNGNANTIDIQKLPKGIYFATIINANGIRETLKFVKQ